MKRGRKPESERGFALLFVFLMAACVAILFYLELPRAAFESQRVKEGMLIERGEQYSRAIKLYVRKWNKYPANLEELENTNNIRYLRRRYRDPLSGKEEWRLIHVGPGGVFTDSLVYDRAKDVMGGDKDKSKDGKSESTFIATRATFGSMDPLAGTEGTRGSRYKKRRAWEREKKTSSEEDPNATTADASTSSGGTTTTAPSNLNPTVDPQTGAPMVPPMPNVSGVPPAGTGMAPAASNQALDMIRRILTTPRQGGLAGITSGGTQIGGGLAGVASKVEEEGIKAYNDRTAYNEWEFVYDVRKDAAKATAGMAGTQQGTQTTPGVTLGTQSPFGGTTGQGR